MEIKNLSVETKAIIETWGETFKIIYNDIGILYMFWFQQDNKVICLLSLPRITGQHSTENVPIQHQFLS